MRDPFTFSHVKHTTIAKAFCASLSVPSLAQHPRIVKENADALTEATVLVLVTGHWAQEYSLAAFTTNYHPVMCSHDKIAQVKYDHLDRLGARSDKCDELTKDYSAIQFHSTMACFVVGPITPGESRAASRSSPTWQSCPGCWWTGWTG